MKKYYRIIILTFMLVLVALRFSICTGPSAEITEEVSDVPEIDAVSEALEDIPSGPVSVEIGLSDGTVFSSASDTEILDITDSSLVSLLPDYSGEFTNLKNVNISDGLEFSYADIEAIKAAFPECEVNYRVIILGSEISADTVELDLSELQSEDVEEAARELKKLPSLQRVNLMPEGISFDTEAEGTDTDTVYKGNITIEDVGVLVASAPGAVFDYRFLLYGKEVSTADESIEFENVNIGDDGVQNIIRPILPSMGNLKYLKLDKCETTSEVMAQLRDDFPDIKIVWRIYFSSYGDGPLGKVTYNCLTDTDHIWATGCVTDFYAQELKYCTDVVYLDMGHNCITNIDFVSFMPKLEVAVLSITWVEDISPLVSCPNLEYLEIFTSKVTDITPLASCTSLKHLNISNLSEVTDISCLYELELERLYCTMSSIPQEQQDKFSELHPDCECEFGWVDPSKGHWRFIDGNYLNTDPDNRVERYAKLCEQIGYDDYSNLSC